MFKIVGNDNSEFFIEIEKARKISQLFSDAIENKEEGEEVDELQINCEYSQKYLKPVIDTINEYNYEQYTISKPVDEFFKDKKHKDNVPIWLINKFIDFELEELIDFLKLSDFLNVSFLVQFLTALIASKIKHLEEDEIRERFK